MHSTSATNAAILDELLTKWEEMGYAFGTLDELGAQPCAQGSPHVIALDAGHGGMDTGAAGQMCIRDRRSNVPAGTKNVST